MIIFPSMIASVIIVGGYIVGWILVTGVTIWVLASAFQAVY